MKVFIKQIGLNGLELSETYPAAFARLTSESDIWFTSPIEVQAEVSRAEKEVITKLHAESRYESFCGRCLDEVQRQWRADFSIIMDADKTTEFIELDEDIRQELILHLPLKVVCQQGCKGLCPDCGVNLNTESCQCVFSNHSKLC